MDYREQLYQVIEKYFMDIAVSYGPVNEEAMQLVKKFRPFQKKNYCQYIEKYRQIAEEAERISVDHIQIPTDDIEAEELKGAFEKSRESFILLCRRNINFFDFQDRKSKKRNVSLEEFKDVSMALTAILNTAGRDMDRLENLYKSMKGIAEPKEAEQTENENDIQE